MATYCMIPTVDILEKEKLWRKLKDQWLPGVGRVGMNRQITEDFQGNENTMYDNIKMDICYYTFVQTYRISPKSES